MLMMKENNAIIHTVVVDENGENPMTADGVYLNKTYAMTYKI